MGQGHYRASELENTLIGEERRSQRGEVMGRWSESISGRIKGIMVKGREGGRGSLIKIVAELGQGDDSVVGG